MDIIGVIAEYNPFHNGHAYQIQQIRAAHKNCTIIAIMSGNYVQRGEFAVADKYSRANAAVLCGVDAVFELMPIYSMQPANIFAGAGVRILSMLGGVTHICFGSECGDIDALMRVSRFINTDGFKESLRTVISENPALTYPKAVGFTCGKLNFNSGDILGGSNNILALEYLAALERYEINEITPFTVKRSGENFNSTDSHETFASATYLRSLVKKIRGKQKTSPLGQIEGADLYELEKNMPSQSYGLLLELLSSGKTSAANSMETAILSHIKRLDANRIAQTPDIAGGMENRIFRAAAESMTLARLTGELSQKHLTSSAVNRMIMNIFLGITKEEQKSTPAFTSLLAANKKGRDYISSVRKTTVIDIITKPASYSSELYRKCLLCDDIFRLSCGIPVSTIKSSPTIL